MLRAMKKFILIVIMCVIPANIKAETEVYFTPSKDCENLIISEIQQAQKNIDIAIYSFTHKRIAKALIKAHKNGISIRLLAQKSGKDSKAIALFNRGLDVQVNNKYSYLHDKFAIFDNARVITGSYNWTRHASNNNSENCLLIKKEDKTIKAYQDRFIKLWQENNKEESNNWLLKQTSLK